MRKRNLTHPEQSTRLLGWGSPGSNTPVTQHTLLARVETQSTETTDKNICYETFKGWKPGQDSQTTNKIQQNPTTSVNRIYLFIYQTWLSLSLSLSLFSFFFFLHMTHIKLRSCSGQPERFTFKHLQTWINGLNQKARCSHLFRAKTNTGAVTRRGQCYKSGARHI